MRYSVISMKIGKNSIPGVRCLVKKIEVKKVISALDRRK
jgi:hypothetical protein